MLGDTDWYFDIKIFHNMFSEYPYDVIVAEHQNTRHVDGRWYYDIRPNFLCGAHWAVQIAQRAPDGSYAGPLSPESNRLATEFDGCGKRGGGEEPGGNTDNTMNP